MPPPGRPIFPSRSCKIDAVRMMHAFGMLRPSDGITNRRGLIRAGGSNEGVCDFLKKYRRDPTHLFDHLWRVTRKMPFQFLENALWILQSEIAFRMAEPFSFVFPAFHLIRAAVFVPAGEITVCVVFGIAVIITQNAGRV